MFNQPTPNNRSTSLFPRRQRLRLRSTVALQFEGIPDENQLQHHLTALLNPNDIRICILHVRAVCVSGSIHTILCLDLLAAPSSSSQATSGMPHISSSGPQATSHFGQSAAHGHCWQDCWPASWRQNIAKCLKSIWTCKCLGQQHEPGISIGPTSPAQQPELQQPLRPEQQGEQQQQEQQQQGQQQPEAFQSAYATVSPDIRSASKHQHMLVLQHMQQIREQLHAYGGCAYLRPTCLNEAMTVSVQLGLAQNHQPGVQPGSHVRVLAADGDAIIMDEQATVPLDYVIRFELDPCATTQAHAGSSSSWRCVDLHVLSMQPGQAGALLATARTLLLPAGPAQEVIAIADTMAQEVSGSLLQMVPPIEEQASTSTAQPQDAQAVAHASQVIAWQEHLQPLLVDMAFLLASAACVAEQQQQQQGQARLLQAAPHTAPAALLDTEEQQAAAAAVAPGGISPAGSRDAETTLVPPSPAAAPSTLAAQTAILAATRLLVPSSESGTTGAVSSDARAAAPSSSIASASSHVALAAAPAAAEPFFDLAQQVVSFCMDAGMPQTAALLMQALQPVGWQFRRGEEVVAEPAAEEAPEG